MPTRPRVTLSRRAFLGSLVAAGAAARFRPIGAQGASPASPSRSGAGVPVLTRQIPSSPDGETLPLVGLGSWITFNVGADRVARDACAEVIGAFLAAGGCLIDSSPMYGSSQAVIGHGLARAAPAGGAGPRRLFAADKVWISSGARGPQQIEDSRRAWGIARFDLLQVHNLLSWEEHLETLQEMKAAGAVRYVGITTSEGRRHEEFERILRTQRLDFAQFTYNALDREAEARLLPLAQERGVAVLANRPFRQGELMRAVERRPLPGWAGEIDCSNWAQILLKFIVSHPAVTCAIPATSSVAHVRENLGAATGRLPDEALRRRIAEAVRAL